MLIVHRLSAEGHRYYLAAVALEGGETPDRGEAPGAWWGAGAAERQLAGTVEGRQVRGLFPRPRHRVPAFDLTFAAPKSVSVLHGLGSDEVAATVRRAHDEGVAAGLSYLERHACGVRVAGRLVAGSGFTVARFRHRVSRADDPHLHTHALVANLARGPDGRDHALHSPLLYGERQGAGATYHAVLRHGLTVELGLTWTRPLRGRADIDEVPPLVRSAFSRRRASVLAGADGAIAERGWSARVTRPPRAGRIDAVALREAWEGRRRGLGWDVPARRPGRLPVIAEIPPGDLLPTADRWTRSDLVVALAGRWVDGAPPELLESVCDRLVGDTRVRPLGAPSGRHVATRFTTGEALERQARVSAALGPAPGDVDERPESLDRLRQVVTGRGGRLVVIVADPAAAAGLGHRVAAPVVAVGEAVPALHGLHLGADDVVVVRRPDRMPSGQVEAVVEVAAGRRAAVVAAGPPRARAAVLTPARGPVATVDLPAGDLTAAGTAALAADTAVEDWVDARRRGRSGVLVAEASEVDDIAVRARAALRTAGLIGAAEVGGVAAGDQVWFAAARPSQGVGRHETAAVAAVGPGAGWVQLRLGDGRQLTLGAGELAGVRQAHVVPPLPVLFAGRGEVFIIGGRPVAERHLGGSELHRYVTVGVPAGAIAPSVVGLSAGGVAPSPVHGATPSAVARATGPVVDRRTPLAEIAAASRAIRERIRLPADPAGARRRLDERARLARQWLDQAEELHRRALSIRDPVATAAWAAQQHAAGTELAALSREHAALGRQELEYHERRRHTAPDRARLSGLDAQAALRRAAMDVASGPGRGIEGRWREGHVPLGRDLGLAL